METYDFNCNECGAKGQTQRNECFDLCDHCHKELKDRVRLLNDPEYRMALTRQTVGFINGTSNSNNHKELKLRGFLACVMPEISNKRVSDIVRSLKP